MCLYVCMCVCIYIYKGSASAAGPLHGFLLVGIRSSGVTLGGLQRPHGLSALSCGSIAASDYYLSSVWRLFLDHCGGPPLGWPRGRASLRMELEALLALILTAIVVNIVSATFASESHSFGVLFC